MRITSLKLFVFALAAAALVLSTAPRASADTIETFSQTTNTITYTATLDVSATSATLTLNGPASGFFVNQVGMNLGNGVTTQSGSASLGTWTFQNGHNSVNCSGTGVWVCAVSTTSQVGNNLTLTWNFTGTPGTGPYSLQFAICSTSTACGPGSRNFITNFSQTGTPATGVVPEPGTLGLLGTGLVGIAGLLRRRFLS